ncbi:MAG: hypothetical protein R2758_16275 [Bacteroidales bacterium]
MPQGGMAFADGAIWLAKGQSLFVIDKSRLAFQVWRFQNGLHILIISGKDHVIFGWCLLPYGTCRSPVSLSCPGKVAMRLKHSDNSISFRMGLPPMWKRQRQNTEFTLVGFDDEWSGWEKTITGTTPTSLQVIIDFC